MHAQKFITGWVCRQNNLGTTCSQDKVRPLSMFPTDLSTLIFLVFNLIHCI